MRHLPIHTLAFFLAVSALHAQDSVLIKERFGAGNISQVSCRVDISGHLTLPADKDNPAKTLAVKGESVIDYDERIVQEKNGTIDRTVRQYRKLDFNRKVGDQVQNSALRPEVRFLVIMRHNQFEVPFSPYGPLTWGEIDLVRTDVFTPALVGLLPGRLVAPGDIWSADRTALHELTDLDRIDKAHLSCKFEGLTTLAKRRLARVGIKGEVNGIGEDGPSRHELEGFYYFDLESNHLSYLYVRGVQHLVDKDGKSVGKIEGSFVLTREVLSSCRALADDVLKGLTLDPNDDNTQLLYDNAELGVRFLYPRRWRVAGVSGRQVALDEKRGSGLLITVDPPAKVPSGSQFHKETRDWLAQQKATIFLSEPLRAVQSSSGQVEHFAFDTELSKQRVVMDYHVVRHTLGGATLAARLLSADAQDLQRDLARIARSMQITR